MQSPWLQGIDPGRLQLVGDLLLREFLLVAASAGILERVLHVVFSRSLWKERIDGSGLKELIAMSAAIGLCFLLDLDVVSATLGRAEATIFGVLLTGALVASVSKISIRAFEGPANAAFPG